MTAKQFPHSQLDLTELVLLTRVLLPDSAGVITVRDEHQTAVHNFDREGTALIKPCRLKPLAFKVYCGRGCGLVILRHVSHGIITFCFSSFIYLAIIARIAKKLSKLTIIIMTNLQFFGPQLPQSSALPAAVLVS